MTSTNSHSKAADYMILTLDSTQITRVISYKYLGVWLDEKLPFNVHVDNLVKKTFSQNWVLESVFHLLPERKLYKVHFYL